MHRPINLLDEDVVVPLVDANHPRGEVVKPSLVRSIVHPDIPLCPGMENYETRGRI